MLLPIKRMLPLAAAMTLSACAASVGGNADTAQTSGPFLEPVYVTMRDAGTVQAFPGQASWPGGKVMLYDAISPDGKVVMATNPAGNDVYAFDAASGKTLAVIKAGKAPKGIKISPDGRYAYVSNEAGGTVDVVTMQDFKVVKTIEVGKMPHNVRFSPDGRYAYATLQGEGNLGVIDTQQMKLVRKIPMPGLTGPHNLDITADGKTAYVRDLVKHVAKVDLTSGKVLKVADAGTGHAGIDLLPDGKYVVTGAIADKVVTVFDPATLEVVKRIDVGQGPHGVRASRDSRWLYVSVTGINKLAVIDTRTLQVAEYIDVGKAPFWITVNGNP